MNENSPPPAPLSKATLAEPVICRMKQQVHPQKHWLGLGKLPPGDQGSSPRPEAARRVPLTEVAKGAQKTVGYLKAAQRVQT